jgi:hypothetical protein
MESRIIVYGQGDRSPLGFPTPDDLIQYIETEISTRNRGRYHYTQGKDADVIVLSRGGYAFGHFEILEKLPPDDLDSLTLSVSARGI